MSKRRRIMRNSIRNIEYETAIKLQTLYECSIGEAWNILKTKDLFGCSFGRAKQLEDIKNEFKAVA